MKVILKQDIKDVGKVGELVNVAAGYARNFLFPRKMAAEATEKRVKEFEHWKRVADSRQKKAVADRQELLNKVAGAQLVFKMQAGEEDKLFGSITNKDISDELEKQGFSIDKRDIQIPDAIKVLGQHKALISMGQGLEQEVIITVERISQKA